MKYLIFLGLSVLILMATWLALGNSPESPLHPAPPVKKGSTPAPAYVPQKIEMPRNLKEGNSLLASAEQLRHAALYVPEDCVRLVQLLMTHFERSDWRIASPEILNGWDSLRKMESGRKALASFQDALVDRFFHDSEEDTVEELLKIAVGDPKNRDPIDLGLERLFGEILPTQGFENSRQAVVLTALLRRADYKEAKARLASLRWLEGTPDSAKEWSTQLDRALDLSIRSELGHFDMPGIIGAWRETLGKEGEDRRGIRWALREAMEALLLRVTRPGEIRAGLPSLEEVLSSSLAEAKASEFWETLLRRMAEDETQALENRITYLAPFVKAFSAKFKDSRYEGAFWERMAQEVPKKDQFTKSREIACLDHAMRAAPDDDFRVLIAQKLAAAYQAMGDFAGGQIALQGTIDILQDPKGRETLIQLLAELKRKEESEKIRWAGEERRIERERVRSRLDFMKDELVRARSQNKPSEDIRSLENVVKNLERQVSE